MWKSTRLHIASLCTRTLTAPSHELELLKLVHKNEANLFACDGQAVYGDLEKDIDGFPIQKVKITEKDFHFDKRKDMGPGTTVALSNKSGRKLWLD